MVMNVLHILPTDRTPEVLFNPDGNLRIKGRGFRTEVDNIPNEIMSWINLYVLNPATETNVHIAFEYMNSASTRALMDMLKSLSALKLMSKKLNIKWYYESDDQDILERGEFIENSLNIPIEFIALPNH
jgi:hypothetical protein